MVFEGVYPKESVSVSSDPLSFIEDGANTTVSKDNVTPANTVPLPVETIGTSDVNISNAGQEASADSAPVVLSTEQEAILNALKTALEIIDDRGQSTNILSAPVTLSSEQEQLLTDIKTALEIIDNIGQQDNANSGPVTLSTEQETILNAIKTAVELIDDVGQQANAASRPVTLSTEQQQLLTDIKTALEIIDDRGQAVSASSAPVVLSTEQEAILQTIADNSTLTVVDNMDIPLIDSSVTTIPKLSSNAISIVASLASDIKKIQMFNDIGAYMGIYDDAARTNLLCILPLVAGEVELERATGTALFLGHLEDSDIVNGKIVMNFLG